jgi:hypothetical protein
MRSLILLTFIAGAGFSQENPTPGSPVSYKVEYVIRDGADAARVVRRYTMYLDSGGRGSFRLGYRVPYATGTTQGTSGASLISTQWNYMDAGINIDSRVRLAGSDILLHSEVEISSIVPPEKGAVPAPPSPTVASSRISLDSVLSPGKPRLVASVDDPAAARKLDIEATVTSSK